ncbi:aminodeoxychorismate/anthranilate synthase component II [Alteromonas sediminis]|uniref:Aminodeoxychorismate/anthranilate synthase component II n=1 Tax=Alteromonas sediminis TaxID=2259342 RepID=A0A3N5Y046_9ALTE|nr:aminodeoxychorismate/anthranilate synthase component II [Alteromonas sediminis]RPJ66380.1 aminodeoxychorismate/anthranilate synthase component II [Alteromonas sediminis]
MLLLIDNIDSFTHNLARYFVELGEEVKVVANDSFSIADIERLAPAKIVISPGPCTPDSAGISMAAIRHFSGTIPILGVCLGHQAIGQVFGATVSRALEIHHGKVSELMHTGISPLFSALPSRYKVTRYHSLVLEPASLPPELICDAWCDTKDGNREIMAISHVSHPTWGLQFHPESLLTEYGHKILENFLNAATKWQVKYKIK